MNREPDAPLTLEEQGFDRFLDRLVRAPEHAPIPALDDLGRFAADLQAAATRTTLPDPEADPVLAQLLQAQRAAQTQPASGLLRTVPDPEPVRLLPWQSARRERILSISNWAAVLVLCLVSVALYALTMTPDDNRSGVPDPVGQAPGVVTTEWILRPSVNMQFAPAGLAIAPDGNLWVPNWGRGQIDIYSPDGAWLESWGESGEEPAQFLFSSRNGGRDDRGIGIAWDADGNIYVADRFNYRVQKFGPDRTYLQTFDESGFMAGSTMVPVGIAMGPDGTVYVTDSVSQTVRMYGTDGVSLGMLIGGGTSLGLGPILGPPVVAGDGSVWVPECKDSNLMQYSASGVLLTTVGASGSEPGQFSCPRSLAIDDQGRIFVADYGNSRIQVLDAGGNVLAVWTTLDDGSSFQPFALAIGKDGDLYALDAALGRIIRISIEENLPG